MDIVVHVANRPAPTWKSDGDGDSKDNNGLGERQYDAPLSLKIVDLECKGRILLVDDDEFVRETLAELLEDVGFSLVQAGDAQEALTILRQGLAFDALVTDLSMPGDDGISLIRLARKIKADLPAVLLTGYAEQVTSVATIAGGNFHVLRKPVESDRLIEQLEMLVVKPSA